MKASKVRAVILAAGKGVRMNSELPKVFHEASGLSLFENVMYSVMEAGVKDVFLICGPEWPKDVTLPPAVKCIEQRERLGTGHAVLQAKKIFRNFEGDVVVLPGDAPCIQPETIRKLIYCHQSQANEATILSAEIDEPYGYGRIIKEGNQVVAIREELDATAKEREIKEVNSGIYAFNSRALFRRLSEVSCNLKKKEYYLTDVIEKMVVSGGSVSAFKIPNSSEMTGVNTRVDLSMVNQILNDAEIKKHAEAGVTIINPAQTYIQKGVKIGKDTVIHPFTWIESGVVIGEKCSVGPFAKLRSGSRLENEAVVGSFVEIVRSRIGKKTYVKHLSYIGDSDLGEKVNVGAGTVTANFNGESKNKTKVENGVFLGCNTVLVAPVKIGRGAKTGAGAVVCAHQTVPAGQTVVGIPAKKLSRNKNGKRK